MSSAILIGLLLGWLVLYFGAAAYRGIRAGMAAPLPPELDKLLREIDATLADIESARG